MSKEFIPKAIVIGGEDIPEPNSTLLALLRDGERPKPGEPGTLADRLGHEAQAFLAGQMRAAEYRRTAVKGKFVITLDIVTGPDGSQSYTCETKTTKAKIPAKSSMTFTDGDGELTGRPAEPLTELAYERERKKSTEKSGAGPKVGGASNL